MDETALNYSLSINATVNNQVAKLMAATGLPERIFMLSLNGNGKAKGETGPPTSL
mgnify:CR=1 FL=1